MRKCFFKQKPDFR